MNRTDHEADRLRAQLDPGPLPVCVEERLQEAYARLESLPQQRPAARPVRRALRMGLIAAALCAAFSLTALAATGQLAAMAQGVIDFFSGEEPTTLDSIQDTFEAHNAAVGLEKTDQGITFSVDNISVDDNFINLFGRVQAEGLRSMVQQTNEQIDAGSSLPDRQTLSRLLYPVVKVGEELYGFDGSINDAVNLYFEDDDTVRYARRILVGGTLPDTFTMQVMPRYATRPGASGDVEAYQSILGKEGDWTLEIPLDITTVRSAVRTVEPQVLTFGEQKLDLKKFSVSPLGAIAVVDEHDGGGGISEPDLPEGPQDGYTSLLQYAVRDNTGSWLYWMTPASYGGGETMYEFSKPSEQAQSLTFVPLADADSESGGQEAYAPLEKGGKLEMNSVSGYTIESYELTGRHFEMKLIPYGPRTGGGIALEASLCDAQGDPAYDDSRDHTFLLDSYTDHATGAVTLTMDFYNDEPLLAEAAQVRYYTWPEVELDEAAAVTVPLE